MPRLHFGAFLHGLNPPDQQFALARRAEELGFDSLWTGDHVSFHNPMYESLTLLASYGSKGQSAIGSQLEVGEGLVGQCAVEKEKTLVTLLFAAIPAVVAYNRFTHDIDRLAIRFESFVEEFSNILQRQSR